MFPDGPRPKITAAQVALFAGMYLVFGILALAYMTLSYGRPPVTALLLVCLIPIIIFAAALALSRKQ